VLCKIDRDIIDIAVQQSLNFVLMTSLLQSQLLCTLYKNFNMKVE